MSHRPEGERTGDQHAGTVATENPSGGRAGERHEVGDARSSRRDPPHLSESDESARTKSGATGDAPVLPANAGGTDAVSSEEQDFEVDEQSAYDRRPSQDKDQPPSRA